MRTSCRYSAGDKFLIYLINYFKATEVIFRKATIGDGQWNKGVTLKSLETIGFLGPRALMALILPLLILIPHGRRSAKGRGELNRPYLAFDGGVSLIALGLCQRT